MSETTDHSKGRRRLPQIAAGLGVVGLVAGIWLWSALYVDRGGDSESVHVEIREGSSLVAVAEHLAGEGLLDAAWQLRAVARIEGGARRIRAGEYDLPRGAAPATILELLIAGVLLTHPVTFPEGWPATRVARTIADSLGIGRAEIDSLVAFPDPRWRQRLSIPEGQGLEGYLFPETYRFTRGSSASTVLDAMLETLESVLVDSVRARMVERSMTLHEVLTLASIVEAEATRGDEFARVAAVYTNRLDKGWKLEADPTVAYAVEKSGEDLTYRDLEFDSAYNTYRHAGLPPGPINNPGRAAILASLWPEPGFDAMYFVADGEGGHRFSRTWEEHKRAVQLYRKWQRRQRSRSSG